MIKLSGWVFGFVFASTFAYATTTFAGSWNGDNSPSNMGQNYNYSYDSLPQNGTVDPKHVPWSDNYWESDWGGIQFRWNSVTVNQRDPDLFDYQSVDRYSLFNYTPPSLAQLKTMSRADLISLSPAEKYDIMMGRYDYPTVYSERQRTSPSMTDWQGICHGWVPASLNEDEPMPSDEKNADGIVVPFGSSDVKGLLSYYYGVAAYDFARGARTIVRTGNALQELNRLDGFDPMKWIAIATNDAVWSSNGYVVTPDNTNDSAQCVNAEVASQYGSVDQCVAAYAFTGTVNSLNLVAQVGARDSKNDPNAGAFFVVMANQLGLIHHGFVANLNLFGHNQIWNQPVTGYANHVDYDHRGGHGGHVGITTVLTYVSEIPQNFSPVVGTPLQRFKTMTFSYELDIDRNGQVTGGSWSRGTHPLFVWKHDKLPLQGYFTKLNSIYHPRAF